MLPVHAAMSFLNVIAASLTPAILILAAGSLVSSTLARISRIVDHARLLMDRICAARLRGDAAAADVDIAMLHVYQRRSSLAGRALLLYYDYPDRFGSLEDAKAYFRGFVPWYNYEHRHSGIAMLTPATVHEGNGVAVLAARHGAMLAAHAATPERFINGQPTLKVLPAEVWINRPATDETAA